jgi:hypothetical protein
MEEVPVREHLSFVIGEERGIGSSDIKNIELLSSNLAGDPEFDDLLDFINNELSYEMK